MQIIRNQLTSGKYTRAIHTLNNCTDSFKLPKLFINSYNPKFNPAKKVQFGFNGVGELAYKRTYSRVIEEEGGRKEQWHETVERVVNGTFSMLLRHCKSNNLKWD